MPSSSAPGPPGADLVALAERLAGELAVAAAAHDRDGSYPFDSIAALQRRPLLHRPGAERARRPRRRLAARPRRRLLAGSPAATPRVAIGVNMHLAVALQRRAAAGGWPPRAATSAAPAAFGETLDRGRPRGRDHRDRGQRAGPGPHATRRRPPPAREPAGASTGRRSSARCRRRRRCCSRRSRSSTTTAGSATATRASPRRRARRRDPRRLGRARHARLRQPLGDLRRGRAARVRAARRVPGRQPRGLHGGQPQRRAVPRRRVAGDRRVRRRDRRRPLGGRELDARSRMLVAESAIGLGAVRGEPGARGAAVDERTSSAGDGTSGEVFAEVQGAKTFINETTVRIVDGARAGRRRRLPQRATRCRGCTATSAPARSCTRSGRTARTSSSARSPSGTCRPYIEMRRPRSSSLACSRRRPRS